MASLGDLIVTIGARIDGFEKNMGTVSQRLNAFDREASKAFSGFDKLGDRLTDLGKTLTAAVTLPIAGVGIAATKMAADFELGIRKVGSLVGGFTNDELVELEEQTLEVARALGIDAVKATDALYEAISAGVPKDNALDFIEVASKAAIAGITDTAVAVDALTTIIAAYGLETSDARAVSDAMFQAVNVGKFQFADLASAIGPAAAQAHNLGITYEELLAATSTLSITSGGVAQAVTQIESAMRALLDPTPQMVDALEAIGFQSGSAAVNALGFEGTLQKLREQTKGSAEAFNALFGRIEGASGALGLTGDAAGRAAKDLETLKQASDGAGAAQVAFEEINKSTTRQFEILVNRIKATATELGLALLPAVNTLLNASQPLLSFLASAASLFGKLPDGIQLAVIALGGLVAAIGPAIFIAGQLVDAYTSAARAIGVLADTLTKFPTVTGFATNALSLLGSAATVAGGAFIGWQIGSWIADLENAKQPVSELEATVKALGIEMERGKTTAEQWASALENAIRRQRESLGGMKNVVIQMAEAIPLASEKIKFLEAELAKLGATLIRTGQSDEEWIEILSRAIETQGQFTKSTKAASSAVVTGSQDAGNATKNLEKALEDAEKKLSDVRKAFNLHAVGADEVAKAEGRVRDILVQMHPEWTRQEEEIGRSSKGANDLSAGFAFLGDTFEILRTQMLETAEAFNKTNQEYEEAVKGLEEFSTVLQERFVEANADAAKALGVTEEAFRSFIGSIDTGSLGRFSEAMERLGITGSAELRKLADQAAADYETIASSSEATAGEVEQANLRMLEAWRKYAESLGDTKLVEQLDKQIAAHRSHSTQVQNIWSNMRKQISTIVTDFSRNVADKFVGLFHGNKQNEALKREEADLRVSLEKRTQEWEQYQASVAVQLEAIRKKHADELAQQEADLKSSLAEKETQYQEYAIDIEQQISTLRSESEADTRSEVRELEEALGEKTAAYSSYHAEVFAKIDDLRQGHAEALARELNDLQDQLRDKQQAYDDYIAEVNVKLQRIGVDTQDNIADETRRVQRGIADKQKQFDRDEKDTLDRIERLKKAGKKESDQEIKDLRTALARRKEDLDEYIRRAEEDLQDYVTEAKLREQRITEDAKTELEQRTRDHNEYLAENAERVAEAENKHRAQLQEQTDDLIASLDARGAELEQFRIDTQEKIDAVTIHNKQKLEAEVTDLRNSLNDRRTELETYKNDINSKLGNLQTQSALKLEDEETDLRNSLNDKRTDYETYKNDILVKLDDIKNKHTTIWGDIKNLLLGEGGVFDEIAKGFARMVIEPLTGGLFSGLQGVFTSIGGKLADWLGIDKVLSSIAGIGGDAAQATSAGSGATSGLSNAISTGLSGVVGAVSGVVSAVTGVIGAFQAARQENTLNAIEESTRRGTLYLGDRSDGGILGVLFSIDEELTFGTTNKATLEIRDYIAGPHSDRLSEISYNTHWALEALNSINSLMTSVKDGLSSAMQVSAAALMPMPIVPGTSAAIPLTPGTLQGAVGFSVSVPVYLDGRMIAEAHYQYLEESGTRT